jgi:hypothetical protein
VGHTDIKLKSNLLIYMKLVEEAPENGKESPHSAHANGMNEYETCHLLGECI